MIFTVVLITGLALLGLCIVYVIYITPVGKDDEEVKNYLVERMRKDLK